MRISLNILPEEKREELRKKAFFRDLIGRGFVLAGILAFLCGFLGVLFVLLRSEVSFARELTKKLGSGDERYQKMSQYEDTFKAMNAEMVFAQQVFEGQHTWTSVLDSVNEAIPEGIMLDIVDFSVDEARLQGVAKNRESLSVFEDNLKKVKCLSQVQVPLSSLVQKNDFPFEVQFSASGTCS